MADKMRKTVEVKYSGFKLIDPTIANDYKNCENSYDETQPVTSSCIIPVTKKMYDALNSDDDSDEQNDWAWDLIEMAANALALCAGDYMKTIECLEM